MRDSKEIPIVIKGTCLFSKDGKGSKVCAENFLRYRRGQREILTVKTAVLKFLGLIMTVVAVLTSLDILQGQQGT